VLLSQLDDSIFFMCNVEDVKFLADIIEHVPLPLRARYTFSCAPINKKMPFVCTMFLKVKYLVLLINVFHLLLFY
jgi:ATP-dependent RNA helicase SUPV3L1/SUV3